jgi:hypothetical protein
LKVVTRVYLLRLSCYSLLFDAACLAECLHFLHSARILRGTGKAMWGFVAGASRNAPQVFAASRTDFFDFEGESGKNAYQHLPQEPAFPPERQKV